MADNTNSQGSGLSSSTDPKLHLKKVDLENIDYEKLDQVNKKTDENPTSSEKPNDNQSEEKMDQKASDSNFASSLKTPHKSKNKSPLLIALVFLVIGALFFAGFSFANQNSRNKSTAATTSSSQNNSDFTLIKEFGEVSYKEESEYISLTTDEKMLANNSFIKVGDGQAHVLFANNSLLSIDSNSEVQINFKNGNTDINQLAGNTWNRVKKLTSNESYTVTTPTALATVRGTKFGVELGKDPKTLAGFYTVEGAVNVSQIDENKKILTNDEVTSPKFIEIKKPGESEAINKGNLLPEENQGRWFSRNRKIDKLFDAKEDFKIPTFLRNIRENKDLQRILLERKGNTKKENCIELLDLSKVIKKEVGFIKIANPANGAEFKTTDTIQFSTDGLNPCTQKAFDEKEVKWYLNDKALEFATGLLAEQKNLEAGEYKVTVKTLVAGKEFTDSITFKVVNQSSSSKSSSSKRSSSSSSSAVANLPPTVIINSPANGAIVVGSIFVSSPPSLYKGAVALSVTATDPEDGALTGSKITWTMSNGFGNTSGNGSNLNGFCYSDGSTSVPCTITVTATDSKGLSASASIVVNVVPS